VITSGFQGTFPSGILVGKVEELIVTEADEFQSVTIKLSADYKRIHYVEFLSKAGTLEIDSLLSTSSL
jgi:cell shape-determining protein MreC